MKIAIISMIRESWGGSEELWYAMALEAIRQGHTVIHLSFDFPVLHSRLRDLEKAGAILYHRPGYFPPDMPARKRQIRLVVNFVKKKLNNPFRRVFRHRPDIVLYNGTCYSIAEELPLLKAIGKYRPTFYLLGHFNADTDSSMPEGKRRILVQAYEQARKVFFITYGNWQIAERQLCYAIPNGSVVRNPVNMPNTGMIEWPRGAVQMATVGNLLTVHKGQDMLLSVLRRQEWQNRDWTLNIYGDGSDRSYLERLVIFFGLQDRVVFHGKTDDIRAVWAGCHLLVMPSHMEGMPIAIVEAMLCGRPTVTTDVGGVREWVEDGISGFIACSATVPALSEAMERAWHDQARWEEMGRNAHQKAMTLYDPEPGKTFLNALM
jgi:glycosyltransferase involved in cell wall biosynthesis